MRLFPSSRAGARSGTYAYFQETVLDKQDYSPKAKLMPATAPIVEAVSATFRMPSVMWGWGMRKKLKDR